MVAEDLGTKGFQDDGGILRSEGSGRKAQGKIASAGQDFRGHKIKDAAVLPAGIAVAFVADQKDRVRRVQVFFYVPGKGMSCGIDHIDEAGEVCVVLDGTVVKAGLLPQALAKPGQKSLMPLLRQRNGGNNDPYPEAFVPALEIFNGCTGQKGLPGPGHHIDGSLTVVFLPCIQTVFLPFIKTVFFQSFHPSCILLLFYDRQELPVYYRTSIAYPESILLRIAFYKRY
jgi:hypothetical protein